MADKTIPDLSALTSVDRAADLLEVSHTSDSGNSKKSSVNNLLDLTSHPVGVDEVQTLTNKTITAPTVSSPALSGTITGTYTLGGTPTFPSAVVTLTGSQTLTNKVLTSPTISSPTITNPTLTTDTVNEFTSAAGVTVDGLLIKDSKLATANSVVASNITSGILTNAMLSTTTGELGGAWTTWTPTWANLTIGNATITYAKYVQIGKTVKFRLRVVLGNTTSVGTDPTFSLPVTANSDYGLSTYILEGNVWYFDVGTANVLGNLRFTSTTTVQLVAQNSSPTYLTQSSVSSTVPFTWTTGDIITVSGSYEAA